MFKINEKVVEAVEALGWNVSESEDYITFGNCSPAGEDLCEEYPKDEDILDWALDLANGFDADEHIEMWISARRSGVSGVPSTRELVEDADEIQKMYNALCDAIREHCTDVEDEEDEE